MIVSLIAALALYGQPPAKDGDAKSDKPAASDVKKADDGEKKICKTDSSTGSRIPVKTCRTKAQWDELAEAARLQAEHVGDLRVDGGRGP